MPELRAGGQGNTNGLPVLRKLRCVNEKTMRFLLSAVSVSFGSEWGRDDALLTSSQQCQLPCPQTCLSTLETLENFPCRVFSGLKGIIFYILKAYFHCFLKSNKVKSTLCAPLYNRLLTASLLFSSLLHLKAFNGALPQGAETHRFPSKATVWNIGVTVEKVTNSNNWLQIFSQVKWCWFIALNKAEGDVNYSLIVIFR